MNADYSFNVKIIETHARAFLTLNILAIGRVLSQGNTDAIIYILTHNINEYVRRT